MDALAVILKEPKQLDVEVLELTAPTDDDLVVDVMWSGISTGTERLLYDGTMPAFPGMGYPLVPGYETIGKVRGTQDLVFVPGAQCYKAARGLFGGSAASLVVPQQRVVPLEQDLGPDNVLLALAATAHHALMVDGLPDLIVGHGVVGRLLARLTMALGGEDITVWETDPVRAQCDDYYRVVHPDEDKRRDYTRVIEASGDAGLLDQLIGRMAAKGTIVLAGFYHDRLSFAFPPAFMKEATIKVAAEWKPIDFEGVQYLLGDGSLDLADLVTHHAAATEAPQAYETAFTDRSCLKMVLDWKGCH